MIGISRTRIAALSQLIIRYSSIGCAGLISVTALHAQQPAGQMPTTNASSFRPMNFVPTATKSKIAAKSVASSVFAKAGASVEAKASDNRAPVTRDRAKSFPHRSPTNANNSSPKSSSIEANKASKLLLTIGGAVPHESEKSAPISKTAQTEETRIQEPTAVSPKAATPIAESANNTTENDEIVSEVIEEAEIEIEQSPEPKTDSQETTDATANEDLADNDNNEMREGIIPTPVSNILGRVMSRLRSTDEFNAVGHFSILSLGRDYRGNGRSLSSGVPNLFANGPDEGDFTGFDVGYGRRKGGGRGWEIRFFGFDPDEAIDVAGSSPTPVWVGVTNPAINPNTPAFAGLSGIGTGLASMADVFADATNHRVIRDSQLGSFEFNLLRATEITSRSNCGKAMVELTGGLRAVSFDESISYVAGATTTAGYPSTASYISEVENDLFGIQVGGRMEKHITKGWGYTLGTKLGIFNNRVSGRQRAEFQFSGGSATTPQVLVGSDTGTNFDITGTDNEIAFLGELDFGIVYQFTQRARARVGYRGLAVTNIAAAASQLEENLFDIESVANPNILDDLIVGGFYFGVDYGF